MRPVLKARGFAGLSLLALSSSALASTLELKLDRGFALPAQASTPAPASDDGPLQPLIAGIRINESDKGEHVVYLRGESEFLVSRKDLEEWIKLPPDLRGRAVEGEEFVSLARIPGAQWRFDEGRLELRVTLPPDAFPEQRFAYATGMRAAITPSSGPSALFNYRAGWFRADGAGAVYNLNTETKLHWGDWLFTHQLYATHGGEDAGTRRGLTALIRDDPVRLTRFIVGDATTSPDDLAGGTLVGGLTYAKAYELDPYLVRQPTASFRTLIESPSQVDVYAGANRIYRQAVAPGPLEIGNLNYLVGRRDLRVVVRDAFGRERQLDLPFYFGSRSLAAGLQDFSYSVGVLRENLAMGSSDYGPGAFSAVHRVGVNDTVTLGARAEGMRDFATVGPSVVLRSDRLGELSLAALATKSRHAGGTPGAVAAGYSFVSGGFALLLAARRAAHDFRILQSADGIGPSRLDDTVSASYSRERWGTVSAFAHRAVSHEGERTRTSGVGYSVPLRRDLTLQATWRSTRGVLDSREVFLGIQYVPAPRWTTLASARDDGGSRTYSLQAGSLLPEGEGAAFRVSADETRGESGNSRRLSPEAIYQGRYATLDAQATSTSSAGGPTKTFSGGMSGAVAFVGGHLGLSRPVDDSFALVRIDPPLKDIRVYLNRQEIGRTGANGEVFIPRVVAYVENHLAIDDRDVPIDRDIGEKSRVLVPSAGRGDVVSFRVPQVRGITGTLRVVRGGGSEVPIELTVLVVETPRGPVEVPVGRGGEFYAENLAPGRYPARVQVDGQRCDFAVTIPESHEPFIRLDPIVACRVP